MSRKKEQKTSYSNVVRWGHGICEDPMDTRIDTDPNGSYTGRPKDPDERPVQDADDL